MLRMTSVLILTSAIHCSAAQAEALKGEKPVTSYEINDRNAGANPNRVDTLFQQLHGKDGIGRIVESFVESIISDERTKGIFVRSDVVRLKRTLSEQICYLSGGPCKYTGRDMKSVHKDHGVSLAEFNIGVEILRDAMDAEGVSSRAQNHLLGILAPMKREIVTR